MKIAFSEVQDERWRHLPRCDTSWYRPYITSPVGSQLPQRTNTQAADGTSSYHVVSIFSLTACLANVPPELGRACLKKDESISYSTNSRCCPNSIHAIAAAFVPAQRSMARSPARLSFFSLYFIQVKFFAPVAALNACCSHSPSRPLPFTLPECPLYWSLTHSTMDASPTSHLVHRNLK